MSKCAVENGKMYDIKLGTCDMPLDETDQFYKTVIKRFWQYIFLAKRYTLNLRHLDLTIVEQNFQWMRIL